MILYTKIDYLTVEYSKLDTMSQLSFVSSQMIQLSKKAGHIIHKSARLKLLSRKLHSFGETHSPSSVDEL